jgi:hypothetical protein
MRGMRDRVSPELVLVDPRLSVEARAQLVAQDETLALLPSTTPKSELPPPLAWSTALESSADQHVRAALRRITELSEVEPPKRRSRSLAILVSMVAASGALALVAAGLQLGLRASFF